MCLGEATKVSGFLLDADKRYVARAAVGACTTTGDAEGEVTRRSDAGTLTRAALDAVLPRFTGAIRQRPPMYSALKRGGRPLYELARAGQEVERAERDILIAALRLTAFEPGAFEIDVRCSKGTYIRTLVEDLAAAAGQCAHVSALRRLEAGPFREADMVGLERLEAAAQEGLPALDALLLPVLRGLAGWATVEVDEGQGRRLAQGQAVTLAGSAPPGPVAVVRGPRLLGIGEVDSTGRLAPRRWLR